MPYKRKDSEVWWVSYTDPSGQRIRRSTGTTDRREADALEAKWKLEAYRAAKWEEQPGRNFDELMLLYMQIMLRERRQKPASLRAAARHLYEAFSGRDLIGMKSHDVRGYIQKRRAEGVAAGTINKEIGLLSAAINYARREWGWELVNPVSGCRLREPEGRVRWISRAESDALIRAAEKEPRSPHLPDFIRLALHTACRRGELLGLEWRRIDLQAGLIYLEAEHTKAGKRRSVPLNAIARAAIMGRLRFRAQFCPASPWVFASKSGGRIGDIKRSFAGACKKAGIADFRIHDLRHTCAAWLVTAGVPLAEVRDLLGHSTIKMTERYAHLAPENIRAAVAVLESPSRFGHGAEMDSGAVAKMVL